MTTPASAQSVARFGIDSAAEIDVFRGDNAVDRPNIVVDITGVVRLARGWTFFIRPWFRQPRTPNWDKEIYQAALEYERSGPMPAFDPGAPRVDPIAATYPLGGELTVSTNTWDARAAIVNSAPTRVYVINNTFPNPRSTPVVEAGAGITPKVGLRFGVSLAHGDYVTRNEIPAAPDATRTLTMLGVEGEYSFGYTKLNGEVMRDSLETAAATAHAYEWFIQGVQTLTLRWFVAARQEGVSAPPPATPTGGRTFFHTTEATLGFRISPELTLRGSYFRRKPFTTSVWDQQVGASLVWAHRWW